MAEQMHREPLGAGGDAVGPVGLREPHDEPGGPDRALRREADQAAGPFVVGRRGDDVQRRIESIGERIEGGHGSGLLVHGLGSVWRSRLRRTYGSSRPFYAARPVGSPVGTGSRPYLARTADGCGGKRPEQGEPSRTVAVLPRSRRARGAALGGPASRRPLPARPTVGRRPGGEEQAARFGTGGLHGRRALSGGVGQNDEIFLSPRFGTVRSGLIELARRRSARVA